jgi:ribosomal protein L22
MTPDETPKDDVVEASADEVGRGDERSEAVTDQPSEAAAVEARASQEAAASVPAGDRGGERSETGQPAPAKQPRAKKAAKTEEAVEAEAVEAEATAEVAESKPKKPRKPAADKDKPSNKQPEAPSKPAARAASRGRNGRRPAAEPAVLVRAQAKYVRTSARKARLVCDHIRGKDVAEARAILAFTPRQAAKAWSKLLESAVANAENNHELVGEELRIHSVVADEGPTLKRFRPRAMGRATRIRKRTSHLTITLTPKES